MKWLLPLLAFGWAMEITDAMQRHDWRRQCQDKDVSFVRALLGDGRPPDDRWEMRLKRGTCPDGSAFEARRSLGDRLQFAAQIVALQSIVVTVAYRWIYHWQPQLFDSLGMSQAGQESDNS